LRKDVPNLIRINSEFTSSEAENLLVWRFNRIINEGYTFTLNDFNIYCGILLKWNGIEHLPEKIINYIPLNPQTKMNNVCKFLLLPISIDHQDENSDYSFLDAHLNDFLATST